ncbi:MAG: hypothetical protein ABS45_09775 [Comamonas sp. SCN 65-56]|uniref:M90 family metallopeptidase n=1 Tax=Comamonas sp. SCN 65-56 TaxID=1660095 RepID=UPI000869F72D|nr:M90 family metallopeptidase [Comamonas sp. SCN 65-56]ODS91771.1 MAG: hypothetical protein ABS45_09775 [Comamonas sp. SCN 65-56]
MLRKLLGLSRPEPIDAAQWQRVATDLPFLDHLDEAERGLLKRQCEAFLAAKQFSGAAGFVVDDDVRIAIALQACLPPDRFVAPRKQVDDAGVVHEYDDELAGEAMQGGPVVLSWPDADPTAGHVGYNVVIHEFAHKLDMLDGSPDGAPPLPGAMRERWARTMTDAYEDFCMRVDRIEAAIPRHVDPESAAADAWYERLPLDPYAATDPGEFFAVTAETFFTAPQALAHAYPALYALFRDYFRQDPLTSALGSRSR